MSKQDLIGELVRLAQDQLLDAVTVARLGSAAQVLLQDAVDACRTGAWARAEASSRECGNVATLLPVYRGTIRSDLVHAMGDYFSSVALFGQEHFKEGLLVLAGGADRLSFSDPHSSAVMWLASARVHRELASPELSYVLKDWKKERFDPIYSGLWSLERSENLLRKVQDHNAHLLAEMIKREMAELIRLWKT